MRPPASADYLSLLVRLLRPPVESTTIVVGVVRSYELQTKKMKIVKTEEEN